MAITGGSDHIWRTALTADDATAKEPLGAIREEYDSTYGIKRYMYILASGAITNGLPVTMLGTTGYTVGKSNVAATLGKLACVGVGIGTITTGQYGWIQIRGHHTGIDVAIAHCTSAYAECVLGSSGIASFRAFTPTSVSTIMVLANITAWTKVAAGKSTSGYIHIA